jgi:hypothetical protein
MKSRIITVVCLLCGELVACGQGYMSFDNIGVMPGPAPVSISSAPGTFNPADGPAGAYLGSDYTASLYFLNGTITDEAVFDSSNPMLFLPADVQFDGTTGFQPNGAGGFNRGAVYLSAATGYNVTVQVRAWYNGGGVYTSYDQALATGQNVGESNPVSLTLADPTSPVTQMNGLLPFTVGNVPEPTSPALFGLAGFSWWVLRRIRPAKNLQAPLRAE